MENKSITSGKSSNEIRFAGEYSATQVHGLRVALARRFKKVKCNLLILDGAMRVEMLESTDHNGNTIKYTQ